MKLPDERRGSSREMDEDVEEMDEDVEEMDEDIVEITREIAGLPLYPKLPAYLDEEDEERDSKYRRRRGLRIRRAPKDDRSIDSPANNTRSGQSFSESEKSQIRALKQKKRSIFRKVGLYSGVVIVLYCCYTVYKPPSETCNLRAHLDPASNWIRYDDATFLKLREELSRRLYGQPLVLSTVVNSLKAHFQDENPKKALVLSFNGLTGSGKNHVSNIILQTLYKQQENSRFVHILSSRRMFPDPRRTEYYKDWISNFLDAHLKSCARQLFIFDEVDKMPNGLLDAIVPYVEYYQQKGVSSRSSVFILLSNAGGKQIADVTYNFHLENKRGSSLTLKDYDSQINKDAFSREGGLHESDVVRKGLISHYIPFLPLQRHQVELCVKDYIEEKFSWVPEFSDVEMRKKFCSKVADEMEYFPPKSGLYSVTGCKRVHEKADLMVHEVST